MAARHLLYVIAVPLSVAHVWAQTAEELFEHGRKYHVGEGVELDLAKAQAYYKKALKRNGELYAALYNSALVYDAQGEYTRAQTLFIKAAKAAAFTPEAIQATTGVGAP